MHSSPPSSEPSSPPSSEEPPPKPTSSEFPEASENIKSDKHPSVTSPASSTRVPAPAGITEPVNENASTVEPLAETVKPFAAASPPEAPDTQPLCEN